MLALYHHGSSACAAKVRFALGEKRLEWQGHYVDILKGEQFRPEFLAINPKAVVPVLIADDAVITESTVICEYLEDAFPDPPLYPRSPLERARVRLWTKAVDEELHPACSAITYVVSHRHTILRNGAGGFDEFMRSGGHEGASARALKWQWIQQGLEAPGWRTRFASMRATSRKWSARCKDPLGSSESSSRWRTLLWRLT
jgi:ganglioside-induced differentiation-associated protein 1